MGKSAFIFDNGLFMCLAEKLGQSSLFDKVYYYRHYASAFVKQAYDKIGSGINGVEMVTEFLKYRDKADIFIFPDINNDDIQRELKNDGCVVWGMGDAEWLENDRWKARQWQEEAGLPIPDTERIIGVENLGKRLSNLEDRWVKISYYRGDMETWHHEKWWKSKLILADFAHNLGALAGQTEFIVEEGIDGIEVGFDGWTIDGKFPNLCAFGYEVKDVGYVGKVSEYKAMPPSILKVNDKLSGVFQTCKSRGFFSSEIRVTKEKKPFLIDPCMRCGSPPTEGTIELYDNLAEIIWEGSHGKLVDAKPKAKYVAIAMIHSDDALHGWVPLDVPKEVAQMVKIKQLAVIGGKHYFIPSDIPMKEIGACVGLGNSVKEAIEKCIEVAKAIDGHEIEVHVESFDKAYEAIEKGEKVGIQF